MKSVIDIRTKNPRDAFASRGLFFFDRIRRGAAAFSRIDFFTVGLYNNYSICNYPKGAKTVMKKACLGRFFPGMSKVTSIEAVTLRLSGMRFIIEYEILTKDGKAEISLYNIRFCDRKDTRILEKRVVCGLDEALKLLCDCRVLSWDGFHGAHPKYVKDGTMFSLDAALNGDVRVRADGSENFPPKFREFTDGLKSMLENGE